MSDATSWDIEPDDRPLLGSIRVAIEEITPEHGILRLERWTEHEGSKMQYVLWFHGQAVWKSELMETAWPKGRSPSP